MTQKEFKKLYNNNRDSKLEQVRLVWKISKDLDKRLYSYHEGLKKF